MVENRDRAKIVVRTTYYLTTLVSLGLSVWALYYAYLYFNLPLVLWIFLYIAIAAYLVGVAIFAHRKRGLARVIAHSATLQLVPLCGAILVFSLVSRGDTYKPTPGKPNTYERSFNDMQDKQKAAALANGLAPFKSRAEIEENYELTNTYYPYGDLLVRKQVVDGTTAGADQEFTFTLVLLEEKTDEPALDKPLEGKFAGEVMNPIFSGCQHGVTSVYSIYNQA